MTLQTKAGKQLALQVLTLAKLVEMIRSISPDLAATLEDMTEEFNQYKFYQASYRFGDTIMANNTCYLPLAQGGMIACNSTDLPEALREDLAYDPASQDPLMLMLNRNSEIYMPAIDRILSHAIVSAGYMVGIPRAIHKHGTVPTSALSWNLTAGARSLFMLAPIGDKIYHQKLQNRYGTKLDAPESLQEHWQLFVDLAKRSNCTWTCDVIYFPRKLINRLKEPAWAAIAMELTHIQRASYNIWHNNSAAWNNAFAEIERMKGLTSCPVCSLATAKHMFVIAANSAPGFRPALTDDSAPIGFLKEAYVDVYNLSKQGHYATIMEPAKFNIADSEPVYYSVNYPTFVHDDMEGAKKKSHITLLDEICFIHSAFMSSILGKHGTQVNSLYDVANAIQFSYYHTNPEKHNHIFAASELDNEDRRFGLGQHGAFPKYSQFFKGCLKIARK